MSCPLQGPLSISTRPWSAARLPVSTASTGLLCLSVGACVHRVRSDTGKRRVWPLTQAHHFQCVTYGRSDTVFSGIAISTTRQIMSNCSSDLCTKEETTSRFSDRCLRNDKLNRQLHKNGNITFNNFVSIVPDTMCMSVYPICHLQ